MLPWCTRRLQNVRSLGKALNVCWFCLHCQQSDNVVKPISLSCNFTSIHVECTKSDPTIALRALRMWMLHSNGALKFSLLWEEGSNSWSYVRPSWQPKTCHYSILWSPQRSSSRWCETRVSVILTTRLGRGRRIQRFQILLFSSVGDNSCIFHHHAQGISQHWL